MAAATTDNTTRRQRFARVIALIGIGCFAVSTVAYGGYALFGNVPGLALPALVQLVNLAAWVFALRLIQQNKFERGVELGLGVLVLTSPLNALLVSGIGILIGLATMVGVAVGAGLTLPRRRAQWWIVLGVLSGIVSIVLDLYGSPDRINFNVPSTVTLVLTVAAVVVLLGLLASQFRNYSLRTKLVLALVGVAIVATLAITFIATQTIRNALTETAASDLRTRAQAAALAVGITMDRNVDRLQTMSLDKRVQDEVALVTDSYPSNQAERDELLAANTARWAGADPTDSIIRNALTGQLAYSLRQFGDVFPGNKEMFITDGSGAVIAATDWQPEYNYSKRDWWQTAYSGGLGSVYIGQPEFDPMINEYGIRTAIPIYAPGRQRVVGILHGIYTFAALQRALRQNSFGTSGKIDLLFPLGQVLTPEGTFRALQNDEFDEIKAGLSQPLAMLNYRGTPLLSSQAVVGVSEDQPEPYLRSSTWRTIATIEPAEALAAVDAATRAALLGGLAAVALAIVSALLLAQLLTNPIHRLTMVAEQVQKGDLAARAPVETGDEIGTLARTFNSMTARLQDTLAGLERRVAERTQELSQANLTLQSNSAYLSALTDTSAGLFQRRELQDLLQAMIERAGALVGTEDGFVFLQEPGDDEIEMKVGAGVYDDLVGTRAAPGVGLAGAVWQTGKPMVIDDYQKWEGRLPGSRRDVLHSIAAVPLKPGEPDAAHAESETFGVIGLAYTDEKRHFGKTEVEILQRFAQLASIALDNARLYADSEERVRELAAVNGISRIVAQETEIEFLLARAGAEICRVFETDFGYIALYDEAENKISFPFVLDQGKRTTIEPLPYGSGLTSQVIESRQPMLMTGATDDDYATAGAVDSGDGASPDSLLSVPMISGERVLGVISVQRLGGEHPLNAQDQSLLTTIAATVAIGIENARLAAATRRQLAELASLNRISAVLTSDQELDERLAEVGRELHSIFDVSSVYIALYDPDDNMVRMPFFIGDGHEYHIEPYPMRRGLTAEVIRSKQPLLINTDMDIRFGELQGLEAGQGQMNQSYLGVPLLLGDRVLGAVGLSDLPPQRFRDSDVRLLSTIATSIATAVQNSQLFAETNAALDQTQRLAEREREAAAQVMALNRRLTRQGWSDYLARGESQLVIESTALESETKKGGAGNGSHGNGTGGGKNGHAKVTVPIELRGQVIGEIELEPDDTGAISENELGLVNQVAENLGLALDNARLFTETQRRVTELDALNRISQAVTTELELDALLNVIGEQLRTIFDVQSVYIALYDPTTQLIELPYFVNDNERAYVEPIRYGEGLTSHIIRSRAPLMLNAGAEQKMAELGAKVYGNQAQSYLGVPIFVGDRVTGVISIQSTDREGMFDESNLRLMETIAATVGTAIQNAQLYGAMQQEVVVRQRAEEEIKLSLREKEVLLKEIHHRVKNNLQIISSLLNLQSSQIHDPDAFQMFRESQSRVRSMALIHEKLYQSKDLARIDFDGYVRDLMVYLFRSYAANPDQIRAEINTSDMFLGIDTAIPCGLIISELVTNSLKYGFPDGKRGSIYVGLKPEAAGTLVLQVNDTGVGFKSGFDWRETDSLGLQLVNTLTSQLHGTIEVTSDSGGTRFLITFPG